MNFHSQTTGAEGLELLSQLRTMEPRVPVILLTAWGSIELAVEGMKRGASDFITKPWSNAQVLQSVETALGLVVARAGPTEAPSRVELDQRYDFSTIIGTDPAILALRDPLGRVSPTESP